MHFPLALALVVALLSLALERLPLALAAESRFVMEALIRRGG